MKAAQAVSQEILLDRMIKALMTDMIVHAGARSAILHLSRDERLIVGARGRVVATTSRSRSKTRSGLRRMAPQPS